MKKACQPRTDIEVHLPGPAAVDHPRRGDDGARTRRTARVAERSSSISWRYHLPRARRIFDQCFASSTRDRDHARRPARLHVLGGAVAVHLPLPVRRMGESRDSGRTLPSAASRTAWCPPAARDNRPARTSPRPRSTPPACGDPPQRARRTASPPSHIGARHAHRDHARRRAQQPEPDQRGQRLRMRLRTERPQQPTDHRGARPAGVSGEATQHASAELPAAPPRRPAPCQPRFTAPPPGPSSRPHTQAADRRGRRQRQERDRQPRRLADRQHGPRAQAGRAGAHAEHETGQHRHCGPASSDNRRP